MNRQISLQLTVTLALVWEISHYGEVKWKACSLTGPVIFKAQPGGGAAVINFKDPKHLYYY